MLQTPTTDSDAISIDAMAHLLEEAFINRFASMDKDMDQDARDFLVLMYRNGVADGNRIALTMLTEAQNYHPLYNTLPDMGKAVVVKSWQDAADNLTKFGNGLLEKVKKAYNLEESEDEPKSE
jgi:hypothetical protein